MRWDDFKMFKSPYHIEKESYIEETLWKKGNSNFWSNTEEICDSCAHKYSRPWNIHCDTCITGPEYEKPSNYERWISTKFDKIKEDILMDYRDRIYVSVDGKRYEVINGSITERPGEQRLLKIECKEAYTPYNEYCKADAEITRKRVTRTYADGIEEKFRIKKVIFNDPATIVLWEDGTKTVVKCENEDFDPEKGLSMAFTKKVLGNKGHYFETVKKHTRDWYVENVKENVSKSESLKALELAKSFAEGYQDGLTDVANRVDILEEKVMNCPYGKDPLTPEEKDAIRKSMESIAKKAEEVSERMKKALGIVSPSDNTTTYIKTPITYNDVIEYADNPLKDDEV